MKMFVLLFVRRWLAWVICGGNITTVFQSVKKKRLDSWAVSEGVLKFGQPLSCRCNVIGFKSNLLRMKPLHTATVCVQDLYSSAEMLAAIFLTPDLYKFLNEGKVSPNGPLCGPDSLSDCCSLVLSCFGWPKPHSDYWTHDSLNRCWVEDVLGSTSWVFAGSAVFCISNNTKRYIWVNWIVI